MLVLPLGTQAAACGCFCGDRTNGAQESGTQPGPADCKTTCDDAGLQFIGCFENEEDFPENNDLCWTSAECGAYRNEGFNGVVRTGIYSGQHPTCIQGSGHCYSTGIPVSLNVPILGVTQVGDISTYIDLAYRYLLPVAALIAVVMGMIAGVQYATAGGNQTQVSKAKQRLSNAMIGVVILLSAYVIARLIDPRLVSLEAIRVPLVKQVVLIDPNSSCEALESYGFVISPGGGGCGDTGTIISTDNVDENVSDSVVREGDTCAYMSCPNLGEACMNDGICRTCEYVADIQPSVSLCGSIATAADANDDNPDHRYTCFFDNSGLNSCVVIETNQDSYLNCAQIYSDAPPEDPCSIYQTDVNIDPADGISYSLGHTGYQKEATSLCQSDPCGVAAKASKTGCVATPKMLPVVGTADGITCTTR